MNKKIFAFIIAALMCVMCAVVTVAEVYTPDGGEGKLYDGADILTDAEILS